MIAKIAISAALLMAIASHEASAQGRHESVRPLRNATVHVTLVNCTRGVWDSYGVRCDAYD